MVADISVVPIGTGSPSVSRYVAACVKLLQESGLKYEVTAMGTIIEGDLNSVLAVTARMHTVPFVVGAMRVITTVRIDERRDHDLSIMEKVDAVTRELGEY